MGTSRARGPFAGWGDRLDGDLVSSPAGREGLDRVRTKVAGGGGVSRSLDARAKANVPFVWAAVALILSAPRDTNGIGYPAIALARLSGVVRRATN